MFLRARGLIERINDQELKLMLDIFDGTTRNAGKSEPERSAKIVVKALSL